MFNKRYTFTVTMTSMIMVKKIFINALWFMDAQISLVDYFNYGCWIELVY